MSTSRSSMVKVPGFSPASLLIGPSKLGYLASLSSPAPERLAQLLGKILQHAQQWVGRRLAEAADRGVAHSVRELGQQRLIPGAGCHQLGGLLGSRPAGRALAAALVLEEAHQVERHRFHIVLVGRSEERRVGKEGKSRCAPYNYRRTSTAH